MWQILQHSLAKLLLKYVKNELAAVVLLHDEHGEITTRIYRFKKLKWGISLGEYILIADGSGDNTIKHEMGHTKQSKLLGPLYLFVVGVPSFVMNILSRLKIIPSKNYYKRWPENWADKLGGVVKRG